MIQLAISQKQRDQICVMLESLKPEFGAVGSRDLEVRMRRDDVDLIISTLAVLTQPASPALKLPDGLIKAVEFYRQVKEQNPAIVTGTWKDAHQWVISEALAAADAPHTAPIEPICATGRTMPPHEFSQMVNELRDVDNTQSRRAKIVGVLHAFNIRPRRPE